MWMRVACLVLALILGLPACATWSRLTHVGAQDRFENLFVRKQNCPSGARGAACRGAVEAELRELSASARASAGQAEDEASRIRLLRVAGTAAWQGGPEGAAAAARVAEETVPECRRMEELARQDRGAPAPADCALLEILPALVAHTNHLEQLAVLTASRPTEGGLQALSRIVERYPPDTFLFIEERQEWATAYQSLGPRGRTYVENSRRVLFCDTRRVRDTVEAHTRYRDALGEAITEVFTAAAEATGLDFAIDCPPNPTLLPPRPF
jgi:hypothetical protein